MKVIHDCDCTITTNLVTLHTVAVFLSEYFPELAVKGLCFAHALAQILTT